MVPTSQAFKHRYTKLWIRQTCSLMCWHEKPCDYHIDRGRTSLLVVRPLCIKSHSILHWFLINGQFSSSSAAPFSRLDLVCLAADSSCISKKICIQLPFSNSHCKVPLSLRNKANLQIEFWWTWVSTVYIFYLSSCIYFWDMVLHSPGWSWGLLHSGEWPWTPESSASPSQVLERWLSH